jgi:hypothetical protein
VSCLEDKKEQVKKGQEKARERFAFSGLKHPLSQQKIFPSPL